jgi:hypothetical protein
VDLNREYKQNRRNSFIFKLIKYFGLKKIKYANNLIKKNKQFDILGKIYRKEFEGKN